jgi:hypothetical protein
MVPECDILQITLHDANGASEVRDERNNAVTGLASATIDRRSRQPDELEQPGVRPAQLLGGIAMTISPGGLTTVQAFQGA